MSEADGGDDPRRNAFARVPFTRLIGLRRESSHRGRARFVLDPRPDLANLVGGVHGGVVATLLDVAMASAAVSHVDFALTAVTLGMNASFLAPGHGRLVADGELLAADGDIASCRAQVADEAGRVVARAQGSFRYLPPPRHPGDS